MPWGKPRAPSTLLLPQPPCLEVLSPKAQHFHATKWPTTTASGRRAKSTHPVVPGLVLVVNPVEILVGAVLHAVLGHPLVGVATPLREDPRDHLHLLQVDLQPLPVVLVLGEPGTPGGTPPAPLHPPPSPGPPCLPHAAWGPAPRAHPRDPMCTGRYFQTHPKPWPLRRALLAVHEEYQPVYCSGLEQLIWSGVTAPDSKPKGLW